VDAERSSHPVDVSSIGNAEYRELGAPYALHIASLVEATARHARPPGGSSRPSLCDGAGRYPVGHETLRVGELSHARRIERAIAVSPIATYLTSVRARSLEHVESLVRTFGMVSATRDFTERPQVINSFNDLSVQVFGDDTGKELHRPVRS
jgi:hypothetical protein